MDRPRKVTYRTGIFEPQNLATDNKIDAALSEFGAVINRTNYVNVLKELFDKRYITELVLSGIDDEIAVKDWVLEDSPSEPKDFENSFTHQVLLKLSDFFLFYSSSTDAETATLLREHHRYVQLAPEVIRILLAVTFTEEDKQQDGDKLPPSSPKNSKAKLSQKEQKAIRKVAREAATIDPKPFAALELPIPKTRCDADMVCEKVWLRLGSILSILLDGIRRPDVVEFIRMLFVPQEKPEGIAVTTDHVVKVDESIPPAPTEENVPCVYPMVQPMKAAFYFDSPEDFGKWRILLASQAQSDLRSWKRADSKIFDIIVEKIKALSNGFFSRDNHKRLLGPSKDMPVFEAKMTRDLRLVYIVDCVTDYDNSSEVQVLRVFGIYTHCQMDNRLWESFSHFLSSRGKAYRERCLARKLHPDGGNIYLPETFSGSVEVEDLEKVFAYVPSLPMDDPNQLHHIISLEKYVTLSKVELLDSIKANQNANFPFEVSKNEQSIIQHPHSCYVLGRSGTGKTTTMLFKMLLIERDYQLSDKNRQRPRQMFVTKSRKLAQKVEEHFTTYLISLAFASHQEIQLPVRSDIKTSDEENIVSEDDNTKWRNDLPDKLSDLEDGHFPLFITFDHLCAMIEADIECALASQSGDVSKSSQLADAFSQPRSPTRTGQLVTYDRFLAEYWPKLRQGRFHPLLIFNEFMGVITGSEGTLISPDGYLDRDDYINFSSRMQPVFADHRETVYDMFQSYVKRKRELGDFDVANRTHTIIRSAVENPSVLQKVSHLYVDEAQDNLLIDVFLLRMLCSNSDGLFWAGDTAQTISAGSAFRFNDLKAFLHRLQTMRSDKQKGAAIRFKQPRMFYLSVNYRSHAGIVNCAHSIVEVIKKYWNTSIDPLPRERGNAHGAIPLFYRDIYPEFVREGHFRSRDHVQKNSNIELGAEQCILVRDDKAREKLVKEFGPQMKERTNIVLTLYDSKGLEFNDVLLYNFFHDSAVDATQWRLLLHEVSYEASCQSPVAAPKFEQTRHAALCSELKGLYVAVTRARNNLRIVDESLAGEPMRALWESRGQIESCSPGQELTDFGRPSNEEEWAATAKLFFDNNQWYHAKQCYERAGKKKSAAVADAYYQREQARRVPTKGKGKTRDDAFTSAAKAFYSCAQNTSNNTYRNKYFELAGGCHEEGGNLLRAAEVYLKGDCVVKAAMLYHKLRKFDDIYDIVVQSNTTAAIPEYIRQSTHLYYISKKKYKKAHRLFDSVEKELDHLEDLGLDLVQVHLLLDHNRKREAADLHRSEGRMVDALDLYLQDDTDEFDSMSKAKKIILDSLWQLSPFGVTPVEPEKMGQFLEHSNKVLPSVLDDNDLEEILMFRSILDGDRKRLSELGNSFLRRGNLDAALLCYDHYFDQIPQLLDENIQKTAQDLKEFSDYVELLRDVAFLVDPATSPRVLKLLGIQAGKEDGTVILFKPNVLCNSQYLPGKELGDRVLSHEEFMDAFRKCLKDRLLDRVTREDDACQKCPALHKEFCLKHTVYQDCDPSSCNRLHISPDVYWFQNWISAHLSQIVIYNSIYSIQFARQFSSRRRVWFFKLYEALNPAYHHFGPTSNMTDTIIASFPKALKVLIDWVRAMSSELDFHPHHQFLTLAMQTADFAFAIDKKEAEIYMPRSKFVTLDCPPQYVRKPQGVNTLQEMLLGMNPKGQYSLPMGIWFISHVMQWQITVNIQVFCTFIERVCSLLIISNNLQRKESLHFVMLPRSWLASMLGQIDLDEAKLQDCSCFRYLLQPLEKLIQALCFLPFSAGQERSQFKVGPEFHSLGGITIRGLFIARICRVLGLLGSNIPVPWFQNNILGIFTKVGHELLRQNPDVKLSRLYNGYFLAKTFNHVYRATCRSLHNSPFDEMVRLFRPDHVDFVIPARESFDLRRVFFSDHAELVSLLQANQYSTIQADVIPSTSAGDDGNALEHEDESDQDDKDAQAELDAGGIQVASEIQDAIPDTVIPEDLYTGHSDQDTRAAKVIGRTFSKFLQRKRNMMSKGQDASTRRWFILFKAALQPAMMLKNHRSPYPPYSVYFLGPLPHLLAALDASYLVLHKAKDVIKKRLVDDGVDKEDLDEVGANLTRVSQAMKALKRHQHQLKPDSALHSNCSIDRLRKQAKVISDFLREIQAFSQMPEDLKRCFDVMLAAVLREMKLTMETERTARKQKRPQLVLEDLGELIQELHEED